MRQLATVCELFQPLCLPCKAGGRDEIIQTSHLNKIRDRVRLRNFVTRVDFNLGRAQVGPIDLAPCRVVSGIERNGWNSVN